MRVDAVKYDSLVCDALREGENVPGRRRLEWWLGALTDQRTRYLALFAIASSLVLPFSGVGVDLCWLHSVTGLPCPGCGMTRAFIALSQGDLATAAGANPFALLLYPLFLALGASALLPDRMRESAERWLAARGSAVGRAYGVSLAAFLGFGMLRFAAFLVRGEVFP
ncbi:MAG: DUF2752 domain-containing protein [Myxococcales bacterium]|nr:DUF2752 domain-containing protein [Myxococcales bacterium]